MKHYLLWISRKYKLLRSTANSVSSPLSISFTALSSFSYAIVIISWLTFSKLPLPPHREKASFQQKILPKLWHSSRWSEFTNTAPSSAMTSPVRIRVDYHLIHEVSSVIIWNDRIIKIRHNKVHSVAILQKAMLCLFISFVLRKSIFAIAVPFTELSKTSGSSVFSYCSL